MILGTSCHILKDGSPQKAVFRTVYALHSSLEGQD